MFLGSGLLDGKDLATRQAILDRLKKNEGKITYEDLVDIGVCEPGTLSENGFIRWWKNLGGGPDVFADMLEDEYRMINDFGMTFGMADQEYRKQFEAQRAMAVTLLIAPALGSLADRMVNGPALSPKEMFNPDSRLDSIEWNGWSIKGPQSYIPAPEVAERPGGKPSGVEEIVTKITYKPSSGATLKVNPNKTTTILGSYKRDMERIINEMGNKKSTYFGEKKGGFNVLNVPDEMFKNDNQFWDEINVKWLDEAIARGDDFFLQLIRQMMCSGKLTR